MKKLIFSIGLSLISFSAFNQLVPPQSSRKIQVAILFDTSNSMDGLIDQAKSRIWSIVNEISSLRYQGQIPTLEIALYEYGNDGLQPSDHYIRQVINLTSELDLVSEKLFALTTNGGSEFCGAVIQESLNDLSWSTATNDMKMIYIAGNEPFNQGPVSYKEVCKTAVTKGIFINSIYCGPYDQGVKEFWQDGATCSTGEYFNIDSDKAVVHISTPYDDKIRVYNDSLNATYYGYGLEGTYKKSNQVAQDANAVSQSETVMTERAIVKSKASYSNASWDLIDAVDKGGKKLEDMKENELPEEFKGKTDDEKKALFESKKADRERYQVEIAKLATDRQTFIDEELKKRAENTPVDDFGSSVNESILKKAELLGYEKITE